MSDAIEFDVGGAPFPDAPAEAAPVESTAADPAEQAMVQLEQRWDDPDFLRRYMNGDREALATMTQLHELAYAGSQGATAPATQTAFTAALAEGGDDARSSDPVEIAMQAAFEPSRGPEQFEGLLHPGQSAEETAAGMALAQELHESGLPVSIASALREIGKRAVNEGTLGNHERIEAGVAAGKAALERKHGPDAARIIADASAAYAHIAESAPTVAEALWEAGIDSSVEGVETLARWYRVARTMQ